MAKKALGKGLKALIGDSAETASNASNVFTDKDSSDSKSQQGNSFDLDVSLLNPGPYQPRRSFDNAELEELAASIKSNGVIQPIVVRRVGQRWEIVAGERRWRACKKLGMKQAPVILRQVGDREALELALVENLQRLDINPVEEARAMLRLANDFNMTQEDIAGKLGKSRSVVANSLRLLDLRAKALEALANGKISVGHAKVLLSAKNDSVQTRALKKILANNLSVRASEVLLRKFNSDSDKKTKTLNPPGRRDIIINSLERTLSSELSTRVKIQDGKNSQSKGRIEIEYYGWQDLDRILTAIGFETVENDSPKD